MTAGGVIPHREQVCVCGKPIKPCLVPMGPRSVLCRGWVHLGTFEHRHPGGQEGLAHPKDEPVPP